MRTSDSAPDGTNIGFLAAVADFVDVDCSLTKIELCIFRSVDTFEFEERGIFVLIAKTTFVSSEDSSDIESEKEE